VLNVRKPHLLTAAVVGGLLVVGVAISSVLAQTRPTGATQGYRPAPVAPAGQGGIALIDISRVFKQHSRFTSMMNTLKAEVERTEELMRKEAEALKQMVEQMKRYKAGSPEYKDWERQIAERRSDMNVQAQLTRKEFLQKEAKIYHQVYSEIEYFLNSLAGRRNYSLVLRFNGDQVDKENPEEVLRFINKPVVWHSPAIDITNEVIGSLNGRAPQPDPNAPHIGRQRQGVPVPR
jgi:Skp family chaperone for outer membrane proteins